MRSGFFAAVLLLTTLTVGCTSVPQPEPQSPSKSETTSQPQAHVEHQQPQPPATPRNGERVGEQSLPAELAAWKEIKPSYVPGGISAVVGDSLFIVASPGRIDDDGHEFKISDVKLLDKRVQIEAYLVQTKADVKNEPFYRKDYVKVPYQGGKELPVELKIIYDSAAYAHVRGAFDHVDPEWIPSPLRVWRNGTDKAEGANAAVFGDFLYVALNIGDRLKTGAQFYLTNLEIVGDHVTAVVTEDTPPGGQVSVHFTSPQVYVRIPFQGDKAPEAKVEFR